ncbi:MAG: hypothetical protein WC317_07265 [Candidatus Omnitrophota bacterium]|jgi:hypothetical protein
MLKIVNINTDKLIAKLKGAVSIISLTAIPFIPENIKFANVTKIATSTKEKIPETIIAPRYRKKEDFIPSIHDFSVTLSPAVTLEIAPITPH